MGIRLFPPDFLPGPPDGFASIKRRNGDLFPLHSPGIQKRHGFLLVFLRKGVFQRRTRIAHIFADILGTVEMPQGDIIKGRKNLRPHPGRAAHKRGSVAVRSFPAGSKAMGQQDTPDTPFFLYSCKELRHCLLHSPDLAVFQNCPGLFRLKIGQQIDFHRFSLFFQTDRDQRALQPPGDIEPGMTQKGAAGCQPLGAIVVPRDHADSNAMFQAQLCDPIVIEGDGLRAGNRPVKYIAAHENRPYFSLDRCFRQKVAECPLIFQKRLSQKRYSQMQI